MNVYYEPEKYDLELLHETDTGDGYDFDKTVVWRHTKTGKLYVGQDSGCSCPSPFENFTSLSSLEEVNPHNFHNLRVLLQEAGVSILDIIDLMETARQKQEAENE